MHTHSLTHTSSLQEAISGYEGTCKGQVAPGAQADSDTGGAGIAAHIRVILLGKTLAPTCSFKLLRSWGTGDPSPHEPRARRRRSWERSPILAVRLRPGSGLQAWNQSIWGKLNGTRVIEHLRRGWGLASCVLSALVRRIGGGRGCTICDQGVMLNRVREEAGAAFLS